MQSAERKQDLAAEPIGVAAPAPASAEARVLPKFNNVGPRTQAKLDVVFKMILSGKFADFCYPAQHC